MEYLNYTNADDIDEYIEESEVARQSKITKEAEEASLSLNANEIDITKQNTFAVLDLEFYNNQDNLCNVKQVGLIAFNEKYDIIGRYERTIVSKGDVIKVQNDLNKILMHIDSIFVWGGHSDLKHLKKLKVNLDENKVYDIQPIFKLFSGKGENNLDSILTKVTGIKGEGFHNAIVDSYYTYLIIKHIDLAFSLPGILKYQAFLQNANLAITEGLNEGVVEKNKENAKLKRQLADRLVEVAALKNTSAQLRKQQEKQQVMKLNNQQAVQANTQATKQEIAQRIRSSKLTQREIEELQHQLGAKKTQKNNKKKKKKKK